MTDDTIANAVRSWLVDELFFGDPTPIEDGEDLFELGLDSLGITRLVVFLERRFSVRIPDSEVVADHVRSVRALVALVRRRAG